MKKSCIFHAFYTKPGSCVEGSYATLQGASSLPGCENLVALIFAVIVYFSVGGPCFNLLSSSSVFIKSVVFWSML
jgi:hypothetical protein